MEESVLKMCGKYVENMWGNLENVSEMFSKRLENV